MRLRHITSGIATFVIGTALVVQTCLLFGLPLWVMILGTVGIIAVSIVQARSEERYDVS